MMHKTPKTSSPANATVARFEEDLLVSSTLLEIESALRPIIQRVVTFAPTAKIRIVRELNILFGRDFAATSGSDVDTIFDNAPAEVTHPIKAKPKTVGSLTQTPEPRWPPFKHHRIGGERLQNYMRTVSSASLTELSVALGYGVQTVRNIAAFYVSQGVLKYIDPGVVAKASHPSPAWNSPRKSRASTTPFVRTPTDIPAELTRKILGLFSTKNPEISTSDIALATNLLVQQARQVLTQLSQAGLILETFENRFQISTSGASYAKTIAKRFSDKYLDLSKQPNFGI